MGGNPFPEPPLEGYGETTWYDGMAAIGFIVVWWFAIYIAYKGLYGLYNWYFDWQERREVSKNMEKKNKEILMYIENRKK